MNIKDYTENLADNIGKELKDKQKALKFDNTPTAGSVNPVTSEGIKEYVDSHSGTTYTAGQNITINNNVISAKDTVYTAGTGVNISGNNEISIDTTNLATKSDLNNYVDLTNDQSILGKKTFVSTGTLEPFSLEINNEAIISKQEVGDSYFDNPFKISSIFKSNSSTNQIDYIFQRPAVSHITTNPNEKFMITFEDGVGNNGTFTDTLKSKLKFKDIYWDTQTWTGLTNFNGRNIWTDGENIYYSYESSQYVLNKSNSTWNVKTWTGLTSFDGGNIWTDGENIYYSSATTQKILDKSTSTWSNKTWTGLTSFDGAYIWTDGEDIYYSNGRYQYVLKNSNQWTSMSWEDSAPKPMGTNIWSDGENIYNGNGYVLFRTYISKIWKKKNWGNGDDISTQASVSNVWSDGEYIYLTSNNYWYVLNKALNSWVYLQNSPFSSSNYTASDMWTDGENIYYSNGEDHRKFVKIKYKYNHISAKPILNSKPKNLLYNSGLCFINKNNNIKYIVKTIINETLYNIDWEDYIGRMNELTEIYLENVKFGDTVFQEINNVPILFGFVDGSGHITSVDGQTRISLDTTTLEITDTYGREPLF